MVDLPDLSASAGAAGLQCDRAIFTSLPSNVGEGYRLVSWSNGLKPEERVELTRRAPSHGSLCGEGAAGRGVIQFHLQATGRAAWGFTRVAGTEHTRRGGGRVWTDFLVADAGEATREGMHPHALRTALAAEPPPKQPLGSTPLGRVHALRSGSGSVSGEDARIVAAVAAVASYLLDGRACVVAAPSGPLEVLEDALRMIPASLRAAIHACAGLRFSPSRGVRATLVERLDQDIMRATRGQGVECIDVEAKRPAAGGPLVPWLGLMSRWWSEQRSSEAVELADRLAGGWTPQEILSVTSLCEDIDTGRERPQALDQLLQRRNAA